MSIDIPLFAAFVSFVFVASITPGPNNLMVMASGAAFGWRRSLPHVAGIATGAIVMLIAVNLGLGAIFERAPIVGLLLRFGGAIWLVWLAWQLARPVLVASDGGDAENAGSTPPARPLTFLQAALFQWVNPKTWSIMVAISGAYIGLAATPAFRALLMACTFAVVAPLSNCTWLLAGHTLKQLLTRDRTRRIALLTMSALVLFSAALIAIG